MAALRPTPAVTVAVARRGADPRIIVVLDSWSPSSRLSLWEPVLRLTEDVLVIAPSPGPDLPGAEWRASSLGEALESVRACSVVLSGGHYLPLGAAAHHRAADVGARFLTAQHGLMTPLAPPLAPRTTLLAWSTADGTFWGSGRADVDVEVVGSQLLWDALRGNRGTPEPTAGPVYLGQLHAAELDRRALVRSASAFCLREGATYRPHPSESDRASVRQHRAWEAMGMAIDRSSQPLSALHAPVVSVFSTGVLEAAARGVDAWVHFEGSPPAWLEEFWDRYALHPWGGSPTPPPVQPAREPSSAVAHILAGMMEA